MILSSGVKPLLIHALLPLVAALALTLRMPFLRRKR